MSLTFLADWHHTVVGVIILFAVLTGCAKVAALKMRWRDGQEVRRILAILACAYCAYINWLRFVGLAKYDPMALAQGALYILPFLVIIGWFGIYEALTDKHKG